MRYSELLNTRQMCGYLGKSYPTFRKFLVLYPELAQMQLSDGCWSKRQVDQFLENVTNENINQQVAYECMRLREVV